MFSRIHNQRARASQNLSLQNKFILKTQELEGLREREIRRSAAGAFVDGDFESCTRWLPAGERFCAPAAGAA